MECNKKCINKVVFPIGNTCIVTFDFEVDSEVYELPPQYDFLVGIFDLKENLIKKATLSSGTIVKGTLGKYFMPITHEESLKLKCDVIMELTILTEDKTIVCHSKDVVYLQGEYRMNNSLI